MLCFEMMSTLLFSACGMLLPGTYENSGPQYPVPSLGEENWDLICEKNDLSGNGWKLRISFRVGLWTINRVTI